MGYMQQKLFEQIVKNQFHMKTRWNPQLEVFFFQGFQKTLQCLKALDRDTLIEQSPTLIEQSHTLIMLHRSLSETTTSYSEL